MCAFSTKMLMMALFGCMVRGRTRAINIRRIQGWWGGGEMCIVWCQSRRVGRQLPAVRCQRCQSRGLLGQWRRGVVPNRIGSCCGRVRPDRQSSRQGCDGRQSAKTGNGRACEPSRPTWRSRPNVASHNASQCLATPSRCSRCPAQRAADNSRPVPFSRKVETHPPPSAPPRSRPVAKSIHQSARATSCKQPRMRGM
ncbi:hypothetical protein B0T16DRAFT_227806 [Cercophora newfieldiana]|uniref:Secreted protein n=1 Tax=Cercophora newfieldiana TaxID=92897 RepID=A0AA40CIP4_9PEZI|nr:hypothetical protein B0T16DRAFT_227806 [Cercophora newfieldiana]